MRDALESLAQFAGLIGLAGFYYGSMLSAPLALAMAVFNLAFLAACLAAFAARKFKEGRAGKSPTPGRTPPP